MSDEEINLSIAEALGWQITKPKGHEDDPRYWSFVPPGKKPMKDCNYTARPGDFCNDLNAMASARKSLTRDQRPIYTTKLRKLLMTEAGVSDWDTTDATAQQHARAFLLATGRARA